MIGSALIACTNISGLNAEDVTSVRHIDKYTGIDAGQGIKVNVVAGFSDSVTVTAPDDIIDRIVTEVKNGTLIIRWDRKANIKSPRHIEVVVSACAVNQIKASSGATVITDTIKGNELNMGSVMNSLRLAVVGRTVGPDMLTLVMMLGKEETIRRVQRAIDTIGEIDN